MSKRDERGNVLVVGLMLIIVIAGFCSSFLMTITASERASTSSLRRIQALYVAEAGVSDGVVYLLTGLEADQSASRGSSVTPISFGGGGYWVTANRDGSGSCEVESVGRYAGEVVTIESFWRIGSPLREYAIFAGGAGDGTGGSIEFGGTGGDADVVNGNVYVQGDASLNGGSSITGDLSVTGVVSGESAVGGEATEAAPPIAAPDLGLMDYEATADLKVDATTPFDGNGVLPESDPRHIIVKEFRDDLASSTGFTFDNVNYFLGDPHETNRIDEISVPTAGNHQVYFVDGNLWVEPDGDTSRIVRSPAGGTVITIVAKGNIYFADTLSYENAAEDALLFVALADCESYTDMDGDNQYDPGEPLLNDDGDGVYEGNVEGSGNIYFGDPNGGPLGHVHGFLYAENHFEDHVRSSSGGDALEFEIAGFMSAGNQVRINRDFGSGNARMAVHSDSRLTSGALEVPGFPGEPGSGGAGARPTLVAWRLAATTEPGPPPP